MTNKYNKGRLTLPSERNFYEETKQLMEIWGADAIRDSDGTKLDDQLKDLPLKVYTTYFVARNHNDFIFEHMDEVQKIYLMSEYVTATEKTLTINIMESYFAKQIQPNYTYDPKEWWEVIDRTTGEIVNPSLWEVDELNHTVTIQATEPFHRYTVSFLADAIWDPTHMYNHITNEWGDEVPADIPFDVRGEHSNQYMHDYLEKWCQDNPKTDVVRFTTFFYHFTLVFNHIGIEKFVDWLGYGASVSPKAILDFEKEYGYRLRPEDFVTEGYYNSSFKNPSPRYRDYVDFTSKFVVQEVRKLVDIVHKYGKEAMMFLGDNWMGTEPYGPYFKDTHIDAVVGSVGSGLSLRLISDIPHVKYTEGRFLPYFFPDTFHEGNDPTIEGRERWLAARRAMMRNSVDRIGYGGYPSLAYQFPKFVEFVEGVASEFREIYEKVRAGKPYSHFKVAVLNAWGSLRSWQSYMVAHEKPYKQTYTYLGVIESLSGMAVDVEFVSFEEIIQKGIPEDVDVIINAGDAGTSYSGAEYWLDERLTTAIREFVYRGGGFIGVGEPTAALHGGSFFQLSDVLGVDKELGYNLSTNKYYTEPVADHFITEEMGEDDQFDFGQSMKNIYATTSDTEIIEYSDGEVHFSSHDYGLGRGIYIAGLPYNLLNNRLLTRAIYYSVRQEEQFLMGQSSNPYVEVHIYPAIGQIALINNTNEVQRGIVHNQQQQATHFELAPAEIRWEEMTWQVD